MSTWSEPSSHVWSVSEMANAVNLNKYHSANQNASTHRLAYKTADQARSNTTLTNDTELFFPMKANDVWFVDVTMLWIDSTGGSADIKVAFTIPSGTVMGLSGVRQGPTHGYWTVSGTDNNSGAISNSYQLLQVSGYVSVSSTAGNFQMQFAQLAASGTTTMKVGSCIMGHRISP